MIYYPQNGRNLEQNRLISYFNKNIHVIKNYPEFSSVAYDYCQYILPDETKENCVFDYAKKVCTSIQEQDQIEAYKKFCKVSYANLKSGLNEYLQLINSSHNRKFQQYEKLVSCALKRNDSNLDADSIKKDLQLCINEMKLLSEKQTYLQDFKNLTELILKSFERDLKEHVNIKNYESFESYIKSINEDDINVSKGFTEVRKVSKNKNEFKIPSKKVRVKRNRNRTSINNMDEDISDLMIKASISEDSEQKINAENNYNRDFKVIKEKKQNLSDIKEVSEPSVTSNDSGDIFKKLNSLDCEEIIKPKMCSELPPIPEDLKLNIGPALSHSTEINPIITPRNVKYDEDLEEDYWDLKPISQSTEIPKSNNKPAIKDFNLNNEECTSDRDLMKPPASFNSFRKGLQLPHSTEKANLNRPMKGDKMKMVPLAHSTEKSPADGIGTFDDFMKNINLPHSTEKEFIQMVQKDEIKSPENVRKHLETKSQVISRIPSIKSKMTKSQISTQNDSNKENKESFTYGDISKQNKSDSLSIGHNSSTAIYSNNPWSNEVHEKVWKMLSKKFNDRQLFRSIYQVFVLTGKVSWDDGIYSVESSKENSIILTNIKSHDQFSLKIFKSTQPAEYLILYYLSYLVETYTNKLNNTELDFSIPKFPRLLSILRQYSNQTSMVLLPLYQNGHLGNLLNTIHISARPLMSKLQFELLLTYIGIEIVDTIYFLNRYARILHCDLNIEDFLLDSHIFTYSDQLKEKKFDHCQYLVLSNFSKFIFLSSFKSDIMFTYDGAGYDVHCPEMVSCQPWRYQVDLYKLSILLYKVLFNKDLMKNEMNLSDFKSADFCNQFDTLGCSIWKQMYMELINVRGRQYANVPALSKELKEYLYNNLNEFEEAVKILHQIQFK